MNQRRLAYMPPSGRDLMGSMDNRECHSTISAILSMPEDIADKIRTSANIPIFTQGDLVTFIYFTQWGMLQINPILVRS